MKSMNQYLNPDIVLYNGVFASNNLIHTLLLGVEAIAIAQDKIIALGKTDEMLNLATAATEKIDLNGRLVIPGCIDTHIHFYEWALRRRDLQLEGLKSLDDLLRLVRQEAEGKNPGDWIMGQGWNETDWSTAIQPNRQMLDQAAPDNPVLLWRCDLHLAVANSEALRQAGIDHSTLDPPEGLIERDDNGDPTGALRELAINLVRQAVPSPEDSHLVQTFEDGISALHRMGITGIHDIRLMSDDDGARSFRTFETLDLENRLNLRCWMSLPGHRLDDIISLGLRTGFGNDKLRIGHVKFFSDGGVGARTAWMLEPYLDAECGMPLIDMAELAVEIEKADRAGLSVMAHAIGDRANRELIKIFLELEDRRKQWGLPKPQIPHRLEHVQMIRPEDIDRLKNTGLALCVTPANMILDINLIESAVGDGGQWAYSFRELMETGRPVMFSSDCPVCNPAPLPAMHAAVTRQRPDGTPQDGWYAESCISVAQALNAYTSTPATVHNCKDIGLISLGKKADLAVLSHNILSEPPSAILEAQVDMTIFDGSIVHRLF